VKTAPINTASFQPSADADSEHFASFDTLSTLFDIHVAPEFVEA